jgi:hypothetical protein
MPPTGRTAASARSSRSTRRIPAESTSSSSDKQSGSDDAERDPGSVGSELGAARRGSRSRPRLSRRSSDHRVRRLRMPLLAAGERSNASSRSCADESVSPTATSRSSRSTRTPSRQPLQLRQPQSKTGSRTCTNCSSIAKRHSRTPICGGTPLSSSSTSHGSTTTEMEQPFSSVFVETSRAERHRPRCAVRSGT